MKITPKDELFQEIKTLLTQARTHVVKAVNTTMVITYFEIGRIIVEHEQKGKQRAEYGKQVLKELSKKLTDNLKKYHSPQKPEDVVKDPYILEFLGLREDKRYSETELEQAIIDKIEHFLLELGKGFAFVGRQQRFTFDEEHFFVDLVFYNRLLKCFVLS